MGYPTKLLGDDEQVQFELRPAWKTLIWPIIWLLVIIGVTAFLLAKVNSWFEGSTGTIMTWVLAIAALIALFIMVIRPFLFWWTTQYVFTNRRIIIRTGIVARRGRDMPLSKVNDVSFDHSVWERVLNCGTLMIESAAENGQLVIENIPNVEQVQREVYRLHDEDDSFRRSRNHGIDPSPPTVES
ncbi:MAG: PH domain-containing protein [Micrococcales bacterium]|nr:PH domain-containing protein [Micrococcales bacterium]